MNKFIYGALIIVLLAVGGYMLVSNSNGTNQPEVTTPRQAQQQPEESDTEQKREEAIITFENGRFTPETLTVKAGTKVLVKNQSDMTIQFDSNPHPAHTDNREMNIDIIRAGSSKSFVATRKGTFGYHDHLNPQFTGTLIVE